MLAKCFLCSRPSKGGEIHMTRSQHSLAGYVVMSAWLNELLLSVWMKHQLKGEISFVRSERVQMKKGRHTPFSINMLIESQQPSKHQSSFCDWARIVDRKKHSTGVEGRARTQGFKPELIHHEILIRMVFHRSQLSKKAVSTESSKINSNTKMNS